MTRNSNTRNPSLLPNKLYKTCRVAVIGGGASGITTAKCLRDDHHEPIVFESNNQIGGIWAFREAPGGTFKSLYFQNSKYLSAFSDYPMNNCVSDFPHNSEVLKYLNDYVDYFNIRDCIRLNTTVEKIKYKNNLWYVTVYSINGHETHEFDAIAVCSGVFSKAKMPKLPNQERFTGKIIHAQDYKEPSIFSGKNVVILGNGASGVDIAVSASYTANKVFWSFRKNTWLLPRYLGGVPIDCQLKRIYDLIPSQLRSFIVHQKFSNISLQHQSCNLLPSFDIFSSIVSVNDDILNRVRIGAIQVKPTIIGFEDDRVLFQDGTSVNADIIVFATGYEVNFPFFDSPTVDIHTEGVDLYKHVFHPHIPNCAFIGIMRVLSAAFPCAEIQARWFSKVLSGEVSLPSPEQMQIEIQNKIAQQKKNWITSIYRSFQVKQLEYIDELAGLINARPKLWRHWSLALSLLLDPLLPAQFRLDGPNSWEGAEDWIRTVPKIIDKSKEGFVKVSINHSNNIRQLDFWRSLMVFRLLVPYIGFVATIWGTWKYGVSIVDLGILGLFILFTALGFTVGYHRLFAHRSFESVQPVRVLLAILGLMGSHLTVTEYVAVHRCHHAFPDQVGDPHSPHLQEGNGPSKLIRGLWHSHSGWLFSNNLNLKDKMEKYASDMLNDPLITKLDRLQYLWLLLGLLLPALLGLAITHTWTGGLTALLWGGLFRIFLQDQVESFGRGIAHYFGPRPLKAEGFSTNHWIAFISLGEWHNNHHAFPHSAKQGLEPWQLDLGYLFIAALEKLGLVSKVKRVSVHEIEAKRVKA